MKYLSLTVACLLVALGLTAPASARDTDPVEVTHPAYGAVNPEAPYVVSIHDPQPDLGDLELHWGRQGSPNPQTMALPHDGSVTVPLTGKNNQVISLVVLRCPVGADCVIVTGWYFTLVTTLGFYLDEASDTRLGGEASVPITGFYEPTIHRGDLIHLAWTLVDAAHPATTITTGEGDWVYGQIGPSLAIPHTAKAAAGRLTVTASIDSERWGHLEGTRAHTYALDLVGPELVTKLSSNVVFPARDGYLDHIVVTMHLPNDYDVDRVVGDVVDKSGVVTTFYDDGPGGRQEVAWFTGLVKHQPMAPGPYTLRVTAYDRAYNATTQEYPIRVDARRRVEHTFHQTIPAAKTLADKYVGACSHLGPAAGRGWPGSLGLYSTSPCAKKNGSVVITVHGAQVPPSAGGYPGQIEVSLYGGAARGSGHAYLVHGWLRAKDNGFIGRRQFDGRLGTHAAYGADARDVVRDIKGHYWVYWQLGLSEGSHYDVKSFTISTKYYALVSPSRSRTASEAKTIAEPSGAPGPGYTPPKTDAVELLAAYSPGM